MPLLYKIKAGILLIVFTICLLFTTQNSNGQSASWTDIFSSKNVNFYDIQKSFNKQSKNGNVQKEKQLEEEKK